MAWAAPGMSVYIFCSNENEAFIRTLLGNKADSYNIRRIFNGSPARDEAIQDFNNTLTDYRIYQQIEAEYIITIQMDCFIRKKLPIPQMFEGDYFGCPWAWKSDDPGGGGSTVRHIPKMIEMCKKYRPNPETTNCPIPEDGWMCEKVKESGGTWPPLPFRATLLMETLFVPDPFIIHQMWSFTDTILNKGRDYFCTLYTNMLRFDIPLVAFVNTMAAEEQPQT